MKFNTIQKLLDDAVKQFVLNRDKVISQYVKKEELRDHELLIRANGESILFNAKTGKTILKFEPIEVGRVSPDNPYLYQIRQDFKLVDEEKGNDK